MSRYDPNSMTRVVNLEKNDFRDKSSGCSSESEEEESINGIFKTEEGVANIKTTTDVAQEKVQPGKPPRGGLFGIKRLGLSRKDRERDADAAAGSVKSDTESKLRGSVETNSDQTFVTLGTALTGDHVNSLLKARQVYADVSDNEEEEDAENKGAVENYWKATEPSTVIRDAKVLSSIPNDEEDEIPISDRIADRGKAERRHTSNSMLTATFDDGHMDMSGQEDNDIEDDLMKYAEAMIKKDSMPDGEGSEKRQLFKRSASFSTDVVSTAETATVKNTGADQDDNDEDDEEQGLTKKPFVRRTSMERLRNLFRGGEHARSSPGDTYDLRESYAVPTKKKNKNTKKPWKRRTSDGTTDSMWSWSQAGNIISKASDGFNRRASNDSHPSNNSGYSNDDDKSHSSGGTFDNSWLGLGNVSQTNGRGGASWRDARRVTLTPFVDYDGNSFHSQRGTPYRMGERSLKRCIAIMFASAIVVLGGALIGINISSNDDSTGKSLTKGNPTLALTEEEKLEVAESVNAACSSSSIEHSDGRRKCQHICHDHFCCFDSSQDGYNCQNDAIKSCSVYAGCIVLVELIDGGPSASEIEHVDSETLSSRVSSACNDMTTSMGKIECHQACDDHMCCFESDSEKSCRNDEKKECAAYIACAVLPAGTNANKDTPSDVPSIPLPSWDAENDTSSGNDAPSLPSWDTAEAASNQGDVQKHDFTSNESLSEEHIVTIESESDDLGSESQVFVPLSGNVENDGGGSQFVPLGGSATSSEGVTEQEVNSVCQHLSDLANKNKCVKLCVDHMCCFESDEEKSCLTNSDCSVYGSCVLLGGDVTSDPSLTTDDYAPTNADDEYSYDDDMFVVDTEGDGEGDDAYESNLYLVGNRTVMSSNEITAEEAQ